MSDRKGTSDARPQVLASSITNSNKAEMGRGCGMRKPSLARREYDKMSV